MRRVGSAPHSGGSKRCGDVCVRICEAEARADGKERANTAHPAVQVEQHDVGAADEDDGAAQPDGIGRASELALAARTRGSQLRPAVRACGRELRAQSVT